MLIRNGTVYLEEGPVEADILVRDGRIAEIRKGIDGAPGEEVHDVAGLAVLPGMIDFHVHMDDAIGGIELADTFLSGSRAAVRTGITTLIGFATQRPGRSLHATVGDYLARAGKGSFCDCHFHLTPTSWDDAAWEEIAALAEKGFRTLKVYTTYREAGLFTDYGRLGTILERCAEKDLALLVHCEDQETLDRVVRDGRRLSEPFYHTLLRPEKAETEAIERTTRLAIERGARLHVVHVSAADGALRIREAQERAAPGTITCETAPHYLLLNDSVLKGAAGHRFLCTPPLRSERNRERLERFAAEGFFSLFATDHCAFTRGSKDAHRGDIEAVPKGLAGAGALVPLLFELLVKKHGLSLEELARRLAANPARAAGLHPRKGAIKKGADADLVALDPAGPARAVASSPADAYETYPASTTTLDIRRVWLRGGLAVADNEPVRPENPEGKCLCRP